MAWIKDTVELSAVNVFCPACSDTQQINGEPCSECMATVVLAPPAFVYRGVRVGDQEHIAHRNGKPLAQYERVTSGFLAFTLLAELLSQNEAAALCEHYEASVLAGLGLEWLITADDVRQWLACHDVAF